MRSNSSPKFYHEVAAIQSLLQVPLLILLLFPPPLQLLPLTEVFFFLIKKIIYFFLAVLGLCCCMSFSLLAVSRGYSPLVVLGPLIAVASLVEHRL